MGGFAILIGMSDLVIPGSAAPHNLHLADNVHAAMVEGDLYDVCNRIKEIDPSLFIVQLTDDANNCQFAVMEHCQDGMDRLVFKTQYLDQRILSKIQRMLEIPFEERFDAVCAEIDRQEAERREEESNEFYERMGGPMYSELARTGFIDRNISYPKVKGKL